MKLKIAFDQDNVFEVEKTKNDYHVNGTSATHDLIKESKDRYLLYYNNVVFKITILEHHSNHLTIDINGKVMHLEVKDHISQILEELGMDLTTEAEIKGIAAPMPGGILEITAKEGQEVQKGDKLIVLEAMKMENVIKAPVDGTITQILVAVGDTVEKNQPLISF